MTVSFEVARQELSKILSDYWDSTTTGAGDATSIIDTELIGKSNDWISTKQAEMFAIMTSGDRDDEERKITSLANATGDLTTLAFTGTTGSGNTYEVHRLWSPSEKRRALVWAARNSYPHLHKRILDLNLTVGNWLRDGGLEEWTSSTALTNWTTTSVTIAQTTASPNYIRGATSAQLDTAAGNISQSITNLDDLKFLAGKSVTFKIRGKCDTASCLRIQFTDGTTTTTSDYHAGDSVWDRDFLSINPTIADDPTEITFKILHDVAAGTSFVDDARVLGPERDKVYIGNLDFADRLPHIVEEVRGDRVDIETWQILENKWVDKDNFLHIPDGTRDYHLRLTGLAYLPWIDTSGVVGTDWDDTIDIDAPKTDILYARAAQYLYRQLTTPNWTTGDNKAFREALADWTLEYDRLTNQLGMDSPGATVNHG